MPLSDAEKTAVLQLTNDVRTAKKAFETATKRAARLKQEAHDAQVAEAKSANDLAAVRARLKTLTEAGE